MPQPAGQRGSRRRGAASIPSLAPKPTHQRTYCRGGQSTSPTAEDDNIGKPHPMRRSQQYLAAASRSRWEHRASQNRALMLDWTHRLRPAVVKVSMPEGQADHHAEEKPELASTAPSRSRTSGFDRLRAVKPVTTAPGPPESFQQKNASAMIKTQPVRRDLSAASSEASGGKRRHRIIRVPGQAERVCDRRPCASSLTWRRATRNGAVTPREFPRRQARQPLLVRKPRLIFHVRRYLPRAHTSSTNAEGNWKALH